jgi:hypothetical protein
MRGMHEQVWQTLDEQGIGRVLAAIVVKVSVRSKMQPLRARANQVASTVIVPCRGASWISSGHQGALSAKDWNVVEGLQCADASDEHLATDATAPDSAVG